MKSLDILIFGDNDMKCREMMRVRGVEMRSYGRKDVEMPRECVEMR